MKRNISLIALWMSLIAAISIFLSSCKSTYPFVKSTVKKGRHDFDFDLFKGFTYNTKITIHVRFTQDTKYILGNSDQWDWNKGIGFYTNINPHKSSARLGWRYNPKTDKFEVGYYVHTHNNSTIHMGGNFAMEISAGQEWWYTIEDLTTVWRYEFSNGNVYEIEKGFKSRKLRKLGGWWFGGNQPAPKKLTLYWYW